MRVFVLVGVHDVKGACPTVRTFQLPTAAFRNPSPAGSLLGTLVPVCTHTKLTPLTLFHRTTICVFPLPPPLPPSSSSSSLQVFTLRGLEKNPTLDVKLSLEDRPGSGYGPRRPGLSIEEADVVTGLLARVRLLAATEGLVVKVHT